MAWFEDTPYEDRLIGFKKKATEIRKLLLGTLLLAEGTWKDYLEQKPAGIEVLQVIKEAEEDFVNSSLADRLEKLEDLLDVIYKRAKGIFLLMEYISKNKQDE
ncbi:MAG: hypothetical protein QMD01_03805 [Thermodesulfovibrionales bacterium]|nr:hypothetical protein [Thermodesulfovibrionales bacterium]